MNGRPCDSCGEETREDLTEIIESAIKEVDEIVRNIGNPLCWQDEVICSLCKAVKLLLELQRSKGERNV